MCILDGPGCGGLLCERWEDRALFSEDISVPCLHPRTSFFFLWFDIIFMYNVFPVLSAFYDIKCLCARGDCGMNPMDFAALKTVCVGVWLAISSSVLCSYTTGCLHICLAPIGQTNILKEQAVVLVNSPQVSIYFEYLFIYFSWYFYCASFSFLFLVFFFLLYSSCTCASTVCCCSKGHCSM